MYGLYIYNPYKKIMIIPQLFVHHVPCMSQFPQVTVPYKNMGVSENKVALCSPRSIGNPLW